MLGVDALTGGQMAVIYLAAVALFVLAAVAAVPKSRPRPFPTWAQTLAYGGLAVAFFVAFWDAWALA